MILQNVNALAQTALENSFNLCSFHFIISFHLKNSSFIFEKKNKITI